MELLEGAALCDQDRLDRLGEDRDELARRGATLWLDMIFPDGFYHADPHPGNLVVMEGGIIGIMDCGMVGHIHESLRESIEELLVAVAGLDARASERYLTGARGGRSASVPKWEQRLGSAR